MAEDHPDNWRILAHASFKGKHFCPITFGNVQFVKHIGPVVPCIDKCGDAVIFRNSSIIAVLEDFRDLLVMPDRRLGALIHPCDRRIGQVTENTLGLLLIVNDPECFNTLLAHYGMFKNVKNYIAIVGPKSMSDLDERGGYFGQKIVIAAQMLGLNTCWVAGTYRRGKCKADLEAGEKIVCVIAIGYGENEGTKHRSKPLAKVCDVAEADMPVWFKNGVKAAMMAPTAMNQQKFMISLDGEEPVITAGAGPMTKIDLGIVKYNLNFQ